MGVSSMQKQKVVGSRSWCVTRFRTSPCHLISAQVDDFFFGSGSRQTFR